jgi:hypothetical protein
MKHPVVIFEFNQLADQNIAWLVRNESTHSCFEKSLEHHSALKKMDKDNDPKQFLFHYISEFYSSHDSEIKQLSKETVANFQQVQKEFFLCVDKIFKGYHWPKEKINCYFSIFEFCPQFFDLNGFQVGLYSKTEHQLYVIFSRLIEEIFVDYIIRNFISTPGRVNASREWFLELVEVFNAALQSSDDFIKLRGKNDSRSYLEEFPNSKEVLLKAKKMLAKNQGVYQWVLDM